MVLLERNAFQGHMFQGSSVRLILAIINVVLPESHSDLFVSI